MEPLLPDFNQLLTLLKKHKVDFMVIGGYAVIFHGYARTTTDLDIWIKPDNGNKVKLLQALKDFGTDQENLAQLSNLDFSNTLYFYFGEKPRRIDFLTKINNVEFSEAETKVDFFPIDDVPIPVIEYHHLILSKISNDRPQDKADIEMLQKINKYKKKR